MIKSEITRAELKEKRTANCKVFENPDHSRTVEIYMEPIHYRDEKGNWKEMDDTLQEIAVGRSIGEIGSRKFCNNKGNLEIQLLDSAEPEATASLAMDTCTLQWGMEGIADTVKAEKTGDNQVTYPGIFTDTDLRCRVYGEGIKEDIILHSSEAIREEYAMLYRMTEVKPVLENNCVYFLNAEGEEVFCVHAPCMKDAAGKKQNQFFSKQKN